METSPYSAYSRTIILVLVTLASFLNPFTGSAINLALPVIGTEFMVDAIMLSWIPSAYLLSTVIFLLPAGRLGDLYGRVAVFKVGALVYTAASFLILFTPSVMVLLFFRFLQGIGSAMIFANSVAIITDLYPPGERGYALGINVTAVYAGLSLGPFLGGVLTQYFGWRSIFLVTVLLGLLVISYFPRFPTFLDEKKSGRLDRLGIVLSAATIFCFFLGLPAITTIYGIVSLLIAGSLGAVFFHVERKQASPLFPVSLFLENSVFAYSNLAALINYSATFAVTFLMSLYLQYIRGYEPAAAGILLLVQPLMQVICSPVAGRLSDRVPAAFVASAGLTLSAASLLGFSLLSSATPIIWVVLNLGILGVGLALFSAPNTNAVMNSVERQHYGSASALLAMMRNFGMMISMGIVMIVFALSFASTSITPLIYPEFQKSMQILFWIFTVLTILGIGCSWKRRVS
jgi:MFS family permease